jgi:hypothetical protein
MLRWLVLTCTVVASAAGCGSKEPALHPVEGTITLKGKALKAGTVTLHPDAQKGNSHAFPSPPTGEVTEGKYAIATKGKAGAPEGWYKVTVHASVPSNPKDEYSEPRLLVDVTNTEPTTTKHSFEVKPGAAAGAYDLKLSK